MTYLEPIGKKILAQRDAPVETYEGTDIIVPDVAQKQKNTATIIAIGPEVEDFAVGDRILIGMYNGLEVDPSFGERLVLLLPDDIHALIRDEANLNIEAVARANPT